ncbi:MMPL family transporter [Cryptosporangium minutisporangium]|uniref:MMPL family transporter n=1 Tax=Cryptosporangium minutisporangium TaxID=113569 RepID=A0ABP6SSW9_9ACTN
MALFLARLGAFSARRRRLVFAVWGAVLLAVVVGGATGLKFSDGGFTLGSTESGRALATMEEKFPAAESDDTDDAGTLQLVLTVPAGEQITSTANRTLVADALAEAGRVAHVESVSNPFDANRPYVSADQTTAVATLTLTGLRDDNRETVHEDVVAVAEHARDNGLIAEVGGTVEVAGAEQSPAEAVGAIIAFAILILTFGSLVAAGANMLGALLGLAVGLLGVFAFSAIHPIGATTPTLAAMIGLAVGIDYGLFILARFRTELREGRSIDDAIARSIGTAGSAVVFAGITVIIALVGLSVVRISFITEMGLAAAVTVAVAVLMALTFLPALMRVMGRRALPRKERAGRPPVQPAAEREGLTFLERWIRLVVKRPLVVGGTAIAALLVASIPVLSLTTALSSPGGEDPDSTQRAAYEQIATKFGEGSQNPLLVLVQGSDVATKLPAITEAITGLDHVAAVNPAGVSEAGDAALLQVVPKSGPIDDATRELVHDIRALDADGVELAVTGSTAVDIDTNQMLSNALIVYLVLVVGLSLLLMIVLFRSLLVPLLGTLGFLLSLGTAIGVTVAVFQWGWLDPLFPAPAGNPLLSLLPILLVGILFGLAMDYQVFLVSRMHEAHRHGLSPVEAVLDGFGRTAAVVVAAALIMTSVFAGFAFAESAFVAPIGLALAVGVLADAFVVRMIIVPALLTVFGESAWWMPRWLDRVLPHIDAEGSALEQTDPDATQDLATVR